MEKYTRKIIKTSRRSYSLVIPKKIIEKYGWKEKQKILVKDKGRGGVKIIGQIIFDKKPKM